MSAHVVWKVPVPGRGHSPPLVVVDRIVPATADEQRQLQLVLAFELVAETPLGTEAFATPAIGEKGNGPRG